MLSVRQQDNPQYLHGQLDERGCAVRLGAALPAKKEIENQPADGERLFLRRDLYL